jgi:hypothetical protein
MLKYQPWKVFFVIFNLNLIVDFAKLYASLVVGIFTQKIESLIFFDLIKSFITFINPIVGLVWILYGVIYHWQNREKSNWLIFYSVLQTYFGIQLDPRIIIQIVNKD